MKILLEKILAFRADRDWDQFHSPKNLSMALMVETAELLEHFQWLTEEESQNLSGSKLSEVQDEIGDVMIYLMNLAEKLGIDPLDAAYTKIEKNIIKYPIDKVKGKVG